MQETDKRTQTLSFLSHWFKSRLIRAQNGNCSPTPVAFQELKCKEISVLAPKWTDIHRQIFIANEKSFAMLITCIFDGLFSEIVSISLVQKAIEFHSRKTEILALWCKNVMHITTMPYSLRTSVSLLMVTQKTNSHKTCADSLILHRWGLLWMF